MVKRLKKCTTQPKSTHNGNQQSREQSTAVNSESNAVEGETAPSRNLEYSDGERSPTQAASRHKPWRRQHEEDLLLVAALAKKTALASHRALWYDEPMSVRRKLSEMSDSIRDYSFHELFRYVRDGELKCPTFPVIAEIHAYPSFLNATTLDCHPYVGRRTHESNTFPLFAASINRRLLRDLVEHTLKFNDQAYNHCHLVSSLLDIDQILCPCNYPVYNRFMVLDTPNAVYGWEHMVSHASFTPLSHFQPLVAAIFHTVQFHRQLPRLLLPNSQLPKFSGLSSLRSVELCSATNPTDLPKSSGLSSLGSVELRSAHSPFLPKSGLFNKSRVSLEIRDSPAFVAKGSQVSQTLSCVTGDARHTCKDLSSFNSGKPWCFHLPKCKALSTSPTDLPKCKAFSSIGSLELCSTPMENTEYSQLPKPPVASANGTSTLATLKGTEIRSSNLWRNIHPETGDEYDMPPVLVQLMIDYVLPRVEIPNDLLFRLQAMVTHMKLADAPTSHMKLADAAATFLPDVLFPDVSRAP